MCQTIKPHTHTNSWVIIYIYKKALNVLYLLKHVFNDQSQLIRIGKIFWSSCIIYKIKTYSCTHLYYLMRHSADADK